jgi:hypothetical protein
MTVRQIAVAGPLKDPPRCMDAGLKPKSPISGRAIAWRALPGIAAVLRHAFGALFLQRPGEGWVQGQAIQTGMNKSKNVIGEGLLQT